MQTPRAPDKPAEAPTNRCTNPSESQVSSTGKTIPKWLDPALEQLTEQHAEPATKQAKDQPKQLDKLDKVHQPKKLPMPSTGAHGDDNFVLTDQVYLQITPVLDNANTQDPYGLPYCKTPELRLLSELYRATQESQHLLKPISDKHAATGQYLKSLNKRVGLLQQFMIATSDSANLAPNCTVALSEAGITLSEAELSSCLTTRQLGTASALHVQVVLFPGLVHLCLFGTLEKLFIMQDEHNQAQLTPPEAPANEVSPPTEVHISFGTVPPSEQQLLAKHILQKQIDLRREQQAPSAKQQ
jgi:hypothetical protein